MASQTHGIPGVTRSQPYRCVAPDHRGFGDTDTPATPTSYTSLHAVGDLYRPERVKAPVNLSVAFSPRHPKRKPLDTLRAVYGNDYYICRFQEPGHIEAEFAQIGTGSVLKEFLTYRNPGPLYLPKGLDILLMLPLCCPHGCRKKNVTTMPANKRRLASLGD